MTPEGSPIALLPKWVLLYMNSVGTYTYKARYYFNTSSYYYKVRSDV